MFFQIIKLNLIIFLMLILNIITAFSEENIVAGLSKDTVEISTTFSGAKILLFGAYNGQKGDDIIVTVEGPKGKVKVQKKEKKFGIWATSETLTFLKVPKYYYVASNRKVSKIVSLEETFLRGLDFQNLKFDTVKKNLSKIKKVEWKNALSRNMIKKGFWKIEEGSIMLNENTLFRKTLSLPSNVTTGIFEVKILHYRNGVLLSQELSKINITKGGVGASIYNVAQEFSTLYGILAVIIAVFFGWFANFVFRRI